MEYSAQYSMFNLRLLLVSRFVSQLGDRLFLPAILWLSVSSQGGSATRLGILSTIMVIPPLASAFIGVFVDRFRKKRLLLTCDWLRFVLCLLLWVNQLYFSYFWIMAALIFVIELTGQFFNLSSGSMIPNLVEEKDLVKANSFFSGTDNITSIIGYAVGGVLIAVFGPSVLILSNGISFLLSGILLLSLRYSDVGDVTQDQVGSVNEKSKPQFFAEFSKGIKIVFRNKVIGNLLLTFLVLNVATASLEMLITIWCHNVLHLSSSGYGAMLTTILIGSLLGSIFMNVPILKKATPSIVISLSTFLLGVALIAFSVFRIYLVSLVMLFLVGFLFSIVGICFSSLVMKNADKTQLGKIFGGIQTVIRGGQPIGVSIITALLAKNNPQFIIAIVGALVLLGGLYLFSLFILAPLFKREQQVVEQQQKEA